MNVARVRLSVVPKTEKFREAVNKGSSSLFFLRKACGSSYGHQRFHPYSWASEIDQTTQRQPFWISNPFEKSLPGSKKTLKQILVIEDTTKITCSDCRSERRGYFGCSIRWTILSKILCSNWNRKSSQFSLMVSHMHRNHWNYKNLFNFNQPTGNS